jgi:hypothetical protein
VASNSNPLPPPPLSPLPLRSWGFGEGRADGPPRGDFTGRTGDRRTLAWYADVNDINRLNVSLVITNVGADFTNLGSFGR